MNLHPSNAPDPCPLTGDIPQHCAMCTERTLLRLHAKYVEAAVAAYPDSPALGPYEAMEELAQAIAPWHAKSMRSHSAQSWKDALAALRSGGCGVRRLAEDLARRESGDA